MFIIRDEYAESATSNEKTHFSQMKTLLDDSEKVSGGVAWRNCAGEYSCVIVCVCVCERWMLACSCNLCVVRVRTCACVRVCAIACCCVFLCDDPVMPLVQLLVRLRPAVIVFVAQPDYTRPYDVRGKCRECYYLRVALTLPCYFPFTFCMPCVGPRPDYRFYQGAHRGGFHAASEHLPTGQGSLVDDRAPDRSSCSF